MSSITFDDANKINIKLLTFWEEDARSGGWAAQIEHHDAHTGALSRKYLLCGLTSKPSAVRSEFETHVVSLILKRFQNIKKCILHFLAESGRVRFHKEKNWSFSDSEVGHLKVSEALKKLKDLEGIDVDIVDVRWDFVNPLNDEEFDRLRAMTKGKSLYC